MRSFIIMKIVRMRAVFIVIASRPTKESQVVVRHTIFRSLSTFTSVCLPSFKLSTARGFYLFSPLRMELNFTQLLPFCILCVLAFYEPHVDRKTNSNGKRQAANVAQRIEI